MKVEKKKKKEPTSFYILGYLVELIIKIWRFGNLLFFSFFSSKSGEFGPFSPWKTVCCHSLGFIEIFMQKNLGDTSGFL